MHTLRIWHACRLFFLIAGSIAVIGCGEASQTGAPAGQKRAVVLINGNSPYWDAVRAGLAAGEKDFKLANAGLVAVMEMNDNGAGGQIAKLQQFGTQSDIVAVAVSPADAKNQAIADEMRELQKHGVHVITLDGDLDRKEFRDARRFYVGTDNYLAGEQAGICAKNLLPEGG
ncbi:MAG TPA: substrate-binding domain-containing protein, partial [Pirellulales bacterium]|nr:substrate-binding domain-containing protein [Pirellulales bacterium]